MSLETLGRNGFEGPEGPVVLAILDGVGIGEFPEGDAVAAAYTPALDWLAANVPTTQLKAHGTAVGLPSDDDMGNSEVGHNAIGAGRVFDQGAKLVNAAIESGAMFEGATWKRLIANVVDHGTTLHFMGLFSDGNVHSHLDQVKAMVARAKADGVKRLRVHILLDGRDVPPTSALNYVDDFEAFLADLNGDGVDFCIASGGGRMKITMDRYNADWEMVAAGWKVHVRGEGETFASAREAIEAHRAANPDVIDQDLPPFVIARDGAAVGPIVDGDSVVFHNFRGDRAIEMSRSFDEEELSEFDRGPRPKVEFAGMMQYDGDLQIPNQFLVDPPEIEGTLGEYMTANEISILAVSETQKYGHVTYFFNGNRSGKFSDGLETYVEVPSDRVPFEQRPWMKAAEITDHVIEGIESGAHRFIRLNYPNGDMVGHTGDIQAVRISVEATDLSLSRVMRAVEKAKGILIVTADHGNADDMYERNKKTGEPKVNAETGKRELKTAHSLNPVPCHVYDPAGTSGARIADAGPLGISSLAATALTLLGYEAPSMYTPSIVDVG